MELGFNGRKKKRLSNASNPVGVIMDLSFNYVEFEKYINKDKKQYNNNLKFKAILEILENSIIPFDTSTIVNANP